MSPRHAFEEICPMELLAHLPEWLVWCAAGGAGALALRVLANMLEAAFELDAG
jgi:hypothetical protein